MGYLSSMLPIDWVCSPENSTETRKVRHHHLDTISNASTSLHAEGHETHAPYKMHGNRESVKATYDRVWEDGEATADIVVEKLPGFGSSSLLIRESHVYISANV